MADRLTLDGTPGSRTIAADNDFNVIGAAAQETIRVADGGRAAFAAGPEDEVEIDGNLADFSVSSSGNVLQLTTQNGTRIDLGLPGEVLLKFNDGGTTANIEPGQSGLEVRLGGQRADEGFNAADVALDAAKRSDFRDGAAGGDSNTRPPLDQAEVTQGTAGADNIDGDQDGATLNGGDGTDRFVFDSVSSQQDVVITDFQVGESLRFEGAFSQGDVGITNEDFGDGAIGVSINATRITLTGLDQAEDGQIFNADTLIGIFGDQALDFA